MIQDTHTNSGLSFRNFPRDTKQRAKVLEQRAIALGIPKDRIGAIVKRAIAIQNAQELSPDRAINRSVDQLMRGNRAAGL